MLMQFSSQPFSLLRKCQDFLADEEASTALEYALMMSLGVGVAYPVGTEIKEIVTNFFERIGNALDGAAR